MMPNYAEFYRFVSPSARRAWVEIELKMAALKAIEKSPSARRAWVEMSLRTWASCLQTVALRKEGVG